MTLQQFIHFHTFTEVFIRTVLASGGFAYKGSALVGLVYVGLAYVELA